MDFSKDPVLAAEVLQAQAEAISECRKCGLCDSRTQVVFGVGNPVADLMFVGEGPGFNEDRQGEPFVGQAGRLLDELLAGIGLSRAEVYIGNVVKCRPPGNRDPLPEEMEACMPFLLRQIEVIRPAVLCTLGRIATKAITGATAPISAIHGKAKVVKVAGAPVVVFPVYHPAAALYTAANRAVIEQDFRKLPHLLARGTSALVDADRPGVDKPDGLLGHLAAEAEATEEEQLKLW